MSAFRLASQADVGRIIMHRNIPGRGYRITHVSADGLTCFATPVTRINGRVISHMGAAMQLSAGSIDWAAGVWPVPIEEREPITVQSGAGA